MPTYTALVTIALEVIATTENEAREKVHDDVHTAFLIGENDGCPLVNTVLITGTVHLASEDRCPE